MSDQYPNVIRQRHASKESKSIVTVLWMRIYERLKLSRRKLLFQGRHPNSSPKVDYRLVMNRNPNRKNQFAL